MKIKSSRYLLSSPDLENCPDLGEMPEIALVGRSNVGKSSFVNTVTARKNLALTSNTPGKTRKLNFYIINEEFALVDLPGYGYAKVSKTMQQQWQRDFQEYLIARETLLLVMVLIDGRHGAQKNDLQMLDWLEDHEIPYALVLTKWDKLKKNEQKKKPALYAKELGVSVDQLFIFSSGDGTGKEKMLRWFAKILKEEV